MRRAAIALAALVSIGAAPAPRDDVRAWVTNGDGSLRLAPVALSQSAPGKATITVDPDKRYQTMVGFGASITDASAILIRQLPPAKRDALMRDLFGRGENALGLDFTRLTIGSSDFSPTHVSFDDMPPGQRDLALTHFSIASNRDTVLPVVKQALAINPQLTVMASPWSPPGWMKTSGSMVGGTLRPDSYDVYARYFVRYLRAYADAGVPIRYVTIQNEPDFSPKDYPGMRWPAVDRARFIGHDLGPALTAARLDTRILEWDHNWDQPEQPETVLADPVANPHVVGVAWHCYGGSVTAQDRVRAAHPDKDVFFTECSGGGWRPGWRAGFSDVMRNLMIGSTRGWARGVLLWNLALDPAGGPHKGGCNNCRGVVTIDPKTGKVTRELEYYALGHLSRFVRPGAVRIAATSTETLPAVAFRNPDGTTVLLAFNADTAPTAVNVAAAGRTVGYSLEPGSALTLVW